MMKWKKRRKKG